MISPPPSRRALLTSSPPATIDSLLARAILFPAPAAANVERKPVTPTMAFSTMSTSGAEQIDSRPSWPDKTSTPSRAASDRNMPAALSSTIQTIPGWYFSTWDFSAWILEPTARPKIFSSSGNWSTTQRAFWPIEPEEPSITKLPKIPISAKVCLSPVWLFRRLGPCRPLSAST